MRVSHRDAAATIPGLGEVRLNARSCGTVYRATLKDGRPTLAQVDADDVIPMGIPTRKATE